MTDAEYIKKLREKRNTLLAWSDWTQLKDVSLKNEEEWQTYRQALRDLPSKVNLPIIKDMIDNGKGNEYWPKRPT